MVSRRVDRRVVVLGPVVALIAVAAGACRGDTPPPAAAPQRVYVSNETAGTVAVIDPATGNVLAAIPVGKRPRGLRVSRDGKQLYVALSGSPIAPPGVDESTLPPADRSADGIAIIDIATRKIVRTIHSGQDPEAFDLVARRALALRLERGDGGDVGGGRAGGYGDTAREGRRRARGRDGLAGRQGRLRHLRGRPQRRRHRHLVVRDARPYPGRPAAALDRGDSGRRRRCSSPTRTRGRSRC